jgi:class 3 adenylate cyclase
MKNKLLLLCTIFLLRDNVNTASRMESSGEVGKVSISGTTYELVKDKFNCMHRGKVQAKGYRDMKPSKALTIKKHEAQLRVYEEASVGEIDMYFVEGNA